MPDKNKQKFHEFALQSALFKGRADLYFCYLKAERIAHALSVIFSGTRIEHAPVLKNALEKSAALSSAIAQFAAREQADASVLASVFELLSLTRLLVSEGLLNGENGLMICREYEQMAEKIAQGKNASPLTLEDFAVPTITLEKRALPLLSPAGESKGHFIKDIDTFNKGHIEKTPNGRTVSVLEAVQKKKRASIKDISLEVRGCSEKTIQRELNTLIREGLIRKEGERRWSVYLPTNQGASF